MLLAAVTVHHLGRDIFVVNVVLALVMAPFAVLAGGLAYAFGGFGRRQAGTLVRVSGLSASGDLGDRLARYCHRRRLLSVAVAVLAAESFAVGVILSGLGNTPSGHLPDLVIFPVLLWVGAVAGARWPRWSAPTTRRLAHLHRVGVLDTLAAWERVAVVVGYPAQAALAGWSLWVAGGTLRDWCLAPTALLGAQAAVTYRVARLALDSTVAAGTATELAWDDVLRFGRVRSLLWIGSVGSLLALAPNAADMLNAAGDRSLNFVDFGPLTLGGVTLTVYGVMMLYLLGPGTRRWQQLWVTADARPTAGAGTA